jgi:hypothetical protein
VLETVPLRADQVVIVNCPGQFSGGGLETIRRFVAASGTLVTTHWALHTTVERAFPGTIEYNQRPTRDDVGPGGRDPGDGMRANVGPAHSPAAGGWGRVIGVRASATIRGMFPSCAHQVQWSPEHW